jgi:hypothetical protein
VKRLLLTLALLAGSAHAQEAVVMREHGNTLRLYDAPCLHAGTLARIPEDKRPAFHKARAIIDGKIWFACWAPLADSSEVLVVYEDGDVAQLSVSRFKFDPGV